MRTRLTALAVACALVAACASADHSVRTISTTPGPPPSTPTTGTPPPSTTTTTAPAPLGDRKLTPWKDCGDSFQCARLSVPLDWRKPTGGTISLAVIRKPATDPSARKGSVFLNPGGPGEPGTHFLRQVVGADGLPSDLGRSFDLVSWDPRGTGDSAGIRCATDVELQQPDPDPSIDSPEDASAIDKSARRLLTECKAKANRQLALVGTKQTVRDLDALRAAVGDAKLTYIGYSYGTIVGTVYAEMFPQRIRALVLDGVAVAGGDPVADTHNQARSFEKNLEAFLADCSKRASCLFGQGDARKAYDDLVRLLETGKRFPGTYVIPDSGGTDHQRVGTVGIGEFTSASLVALYSRENWMALEQGIAALQRGDGRMLLYLRDQYAGRSDDGSWSHIGDANIAINCADQTLRPSTPVGDPALRVVWTKELPLVGSTFATGTPGCFGYPAASEPLTAPTAGTITGVPPLVLVGSVGDPATPYQQAVDLQKLLPGSVLVTWEGDDHTAYGRGSACLDKPVTAYLVDLKVPAAGIRCKP